MSLEEVEPNFFILSPDSPLRETIQRAYRWYSPRFSPCDVPRFADVGSITEEWSVMRGIRDFLVARYRNLPEPPTHIMGFDARGFLLGPMISVELGVPFVLMRKAGKNPGILIESEPYQKEYKEKRAEAMTIRCGSIGKGSRVVLVDDVLATGGTALSGLQLVEASGATTIEFVAILGIKSLKGAQLSHSYGNGRFSKIPFFALVDESVLTEANCGDTAGYNGPRIIGYREALSRI
ncbi:putative Adenine phosphoribosyltransferase [Trypanosoma cruzi]|uniref:adenine phosphoribosyltransferase n=2 Tax=Trypanosoma cruzi TaxID=5693 RepID=Q4DNZ4_TRYCC|nr:adenine phosphoribosyltransferase, putative [Trypanosoma cruzi]EAN94251.1 adenine phosphoribosyltransferase, putative [Trypanosoma cruzi]PWV20833.1 putative Adenine phosphoribosyltransferase [Trypanosoma cruzi]RNC49208.1 adenine phosphoribosyltransferase [Trypanosoma cruzi]|eukprot:XP_816102.1 adenine phosphoribosyltransferase [Trypanosoma cruzi strain CL Brener]